MKNTEEAVFPNFKTYFEAELPYLTSNPIQEKLFYISQRYIIK